MGLFSNSLLCGDVSRATSPFFLFFQKTKIILFLIVGFEVVVIEKMGMCSGGTPQGFRKGN
jgi:hypothetical protein